MDGASWTALRAIPACTWNDAGIARIPVLAPGFRVFSGPPTSVWASTFRANGWRVDMLDDRWGLDITETKGGEGLAIGDAILWVGEGVDENGTGPCVWPPSRVTRIDSHPTQSMMRVWSLRDTWHTAIDLGKAISESVHVPWKDVKRAGCPIMINRDVLQWWTLDVWCPACGSIAHRVQWGMVTPPGEPKPPLSEPWEDSSAELGGHLIIIMPSAMNCSRCGTSWGDRALTGTWWPKDPEITFEPPIRSVPQLLEHLSCASATELEELIDDHLELDTASLGLSEDGLAVNLDFHIFWLNFPFTQSELWKAVNDAEGRSLMRRACYSLEREIRHVEGFEISPYPGAYLDGGNWPRIGLPELPDYPFTKAAPGSWTYGQWIQKRLHRVLRGSTDVTFDVEPFYGVDENEVETLEELRQSTPIQNRQ